MRTPYHRHVLAGALLATLLIASTATTCAYSQTVDVAKLTGADTTGAAAQIQTRAKVIGVNVAAHTVTLHGIGGRTFDVTVSPEVGDINKLHSGNVEQASFAVLKAPDIPSILVETAFISNPEEEMKLRSDAHQLRFARSIHSGVKRYFAQNPALARAQPS